MTQYVKYNVQYDTIRVLHWKTGWHATSLTSLLSAFAARGGFFARSHQVPTR